MRSRLVCQALMLSMLLVRSSCVDAQPMGDARRDQSEAFFTNAIIPRLRITLERSAVESLREESRQYVKATVIEGATIYHDVGLHLKGNEGSFQSLDRKPSLTLNFDKFVLGQKFHGLDKIHFNNSLQDPTFFNEIIGSELFRAAGLPAARVTHARVELNGRDLGLYVLVEGFDRSFLKHHFKSANGNFYDGGTLLDINQPLRHKSGEGPKDRADLKALYQAGDEVDPDRRLAQLSGVLDLDRFYSFLALEIMASSWDGYVLHHNNYWLYNDPETQRFVFLPHGLDQLFVSPQSSLLPNCSGAIALAVLYAPVGRQHYRDRCVQLLTNVFRLSRLTDFVNGVQGRIRPVLLDISPAVVREHDEATGRLRERLKKRVNHLETELKAPALKVLTVYTNSAIVLTGWLPNIDNGRAELTETTNTLQIKCLDRQNATVASWRTRVAIPEGHYRLEGRIKVSRVTPLPGAPSGGVCLRVFGEGLPGRASSANTDDWQTVFCTFTVARKTSDQDFICELQAYKGMVEFEKDSLQITCSSYHGAR